MIKTRSIIKSPFNEISISGKLMLKGFSAKLKKMYAKSGAKK